MPGVYDEGWWKRCNSAKNRFFRRAMKQEDLVSEAQRLPRRGRNHCLIRVTGTATAIGCLYAVKVNLIHHGRTIDILGDIGRNRSYGPPTAGTRRCLLVVFLREIDLIAPLNDEVILVVRVIRPSEDITS